MRARKIQKTWVTRVEASEEVEVEVEVRVRGRERGLERYGSRGRKGEIDERLKTPCYARERSESARIN